MRVLILIFVLCVCGLAAQAQDPVAPTAPPVASATNRILRVIRAELLHAMLQRTNDFVLVDVMPRLYYQDYHIKGSMSVPEEELAATVRDWPRGRRMVVYCLDAECESGRDAALTLMTMGFTDVLLYEGGKREWRARKYDAMGKGKLLD
ncbi:MAG: rhodanese-like domain-containing protein [bacterium]